MAGAEPMNSSSGVFKELENVTLPCEYVSSLMNNQYFQTNSAIHFQSKE
jgi:hypothetical protein